MWEGTTALLTLRFDFRNYVYTKMHSGNCANNTIQASIHVYVAEI